MVVERRVFSRLPCYLQTDQNDRSTYITDDVMFEPERAGFVNGYIGDTSVLTAEDLERLPPIFESDAARQKYQLSLGAVLIDPDTEERSGGAFYPDLVGQISANGGITNDPNRLFETTFYAWAPPFDYDKHTNFTRYYWTGAGNAQANGEYVTKEPQASKTVLYEVTGSGFVARDVLIAIVAPTAPTIDDLWEDASDSDRTIYQWSGSAWIGVPLIVHDDLPVGSASFNTGDFLYVRRTGPNWNRPLMWKFSEEAGRWVAQPVVVGPTPDIPVEGMIWEDTTLTQSRSFRIYSNGAFIPLVWTAADGPSGIPADNTYIYDSRNLQQGVDDWSDVNWWRHFEDLGPADRQALLPGDQAIRPIIEFWAGIESPVGDVRDFRNDSPQFNIYGYNFGTDDITASGSSSSIYEYHIGTGLDDTVLGFPVSFNQTGEFRFDLTLETAVIPAVTGYRYFRDTTTGLVHSIWAKAKAQTAQTIDADGLASVPKNISSNSDHQVLTDVSRSQVLNHMAGNIKAQNSFIGNEFGLNNYRWTDKDPTIGVTIIDCENTLLRTMATLQKAELSIPDVIRRQSRDYNRVMVKFGNRLTQLWDKLVIADPSDNLIVSPAEAVDAILTELFIGRGEDFAYFYSDMGTYVESQIFGGTVNIVGLAPRPIFIPPSPARTGSGPTYRPTAFTDRDGVSKLRGHDGTIHLSYGDDRDLVWLELQNRFYAAVPSYYRDETTTFSARHTISNFMLKDFYGNSTPQTSNQQVVDVVADYTAIVSPVGGEVYFDFGRGVMVYYNGNRFLTSPVPVDDIFFNQADNEYYIYNGFRAVKIERFNRPYAFDYTTEEFRTILRREFERWASFQLADFISNDQYDENDPFTWNYRSAGLEGHYLGIYARAYNTVRPHSHPWEVVGYNTEPDWWQTSYVPTSIAPDGTPRYAASHPMWADLQVGIYNPLTGLQSDRFQMVAPIPVAANGDLLDPIASGMISIDSLVPERRDDSWVYGDGAPVEQQFLESPSYGFAVSLLGYLMKPGQFVDTVWSELYIDIGANGANSLWRAPHIVHRDTLTRPSVSDLPVHLEKVNGQIEQRLGINAWISEYVRGLGNDVGKSFGQVIRNTVISPGWRTSGFINPDRTVIQTLSGIKLPFEDVHTILHRSPPTRESFGSGVLVTREGTGYRVYGFDLFKPYFEIDVPVAPIVGGQVELKETFTAASAQHEFTTTRFKLPRNVQDNETAKLGVMVNGLRLKPQHIQVTGPNTFVIESIVTINTGDVVTVVALTTQSNPSTRVKQFVIDGVAFPYIDAGQGYTERVEYGRYFDTAPDVINFMLGYGRQLVKQGWVFDTLQGTGEFRDWLFGAKQFANWILETTSRWQAVGPSPDIPDFFFSPFRESATFQSPFGQVLNVEALQNGAYGILDQDANPIDPEVVFTSRIGNKIVLTPDAAAPEIFGVRVLVAEDQHVVFLSNITKFNDLVYDPVLALFQSTLRLSAYRSEGWTGRLEADGFIISKGDILPNFEKQAKDITRFYDRIDTLDDPVKRDQARELYGWYPNDTYLNDQGNKIAMMDAIGAEERSRFDFHRGMVHAKGTIRSIIAFSRGTCIGSSNVIVNEDWAWRWCEFGDTRRDVVRFRVNKLDFREQTQVIEFNEPENAYDTAIQVEEFSRATPDEGRWIIPPIVGDNNCCSYNLPVSSNGVFDPNTRMFVKLFDTETNLTALSMFHYDPENGHYDPSAICELDYIGALDPARYTDGNGASYSDGLSWGPDQVGHYWWDQNRLSYMDYRSLIPDYSAVARDWGRLTYYRANIIPNAEIGEVETLNPYTGNPISHNLVNGTEIQITGATPDEYNGTYTVTVTSPTTFEISIFDALNVPATGDVRIAVAFIDVYEWVESPVTPSGWANYIKGLSEPGDPTGVPIFGDQTSYVTRTSTDSKGTRKSFYYFWVKNNTGDNPIKDRRADQIALQLRSPTVNNSGWFGVPDHNHMVIFADGERVNDGYGIEVIKDASTLDYHTEWLLISEGDQFKEVPTIIRDKLIDCLAGNDIIGSVVPSPLLSVTERYGSSEFPPQTVFVDRAEALRVYVAAANTILNRINLNTVPNLSGKFQLVDEGTYWTRAEHRTEAEEGRSIFDTVATEAIRTDRLANKRYYPTDLVRVLQSGNTDLWTGAQTPSTYALNDLNQFIEVGVDNATVNIILDETTAPDVVRSTFIKVYDMLTKEQQNALVFSILYEMMRQTPDADWFMKTSYITMQVFDTIGQSPFIRPNEVEAIISTALEYKPYRTKLRASTFTYTLDQVENLGMQIDEFPDKKISLIFDRLNCALEDDAGWDIFAWDTELAGWDKPIWDWADLGRAEFFSLGTQIGVANSTVYTFTATYDPTLYDHRVIVRSAGQVVNLSDIGITFAVSTTHTTVTVTFSSLLDNSYTIEVQQAGGFYEGSAPTLGPLFENTLFQPVPSSYKHHVPRLMDAGYQAPFPSMDECYLPVPESPQERIPNDMEDCVVICVRNDWTPAYSGWDTTPWDSTRWDEAPDDMGPRVFFISAGAEIEINTGLSMLPTSQSVIATDTRFVIAPNPYSIVQVDLNGTTMIDGIDYQVVSDASWAIEFLPRPDITYTANGSTIAFSIAGATFGYDTVYRNNVAQVLGVDYTVVGTDIVFVQPAPSIISVNAYTRGQHYIGNSITTNFSTGLAGASINGQNSFVFVNGDLLPPTQYSVAAVNGEVVINSPTPATNDEITIFSLGNDVADNNPRFEVFSFVGDGVQTAFVTGANANDLTAWVFIDGRYQIKGVDYTVPVYGTIAFTVAPPLGAQIHMRVLNPPWFITYNQSHVTFVASGTSSDPIPGISDADPDRMVVFVGDEVQNAYSLVTTDFILSDGSPDVINWVVAPVAGTVITVRMVRSVTISQTTLITVEPSVGDAIRITQNSALQIGDAVEVYYNNFPVGPLGSFAVNFVPTGYDVINGVLVLDGPVSNGMINLTYNSMRRAPNPTAILVRMANLADLAREDHLTYDPTLGLEDNRFTGLRILNTTDGIIYTWDGGAWVAGSPLVIGDRVLVLQDHQIVEFNGSTFHVIFNTGDSFTSPPVLQFPVFGTGITSGTYALGQLPDAATEFPEAYQIAQHRGGC